MCDEDYFEFDQTTGKGKCYCCDIEFTSSMQKNQHIRGKKHLKAREVHREMLKKGEAESDPLICKICSVTFSGLVAKQQHMDSEKHMRKENRQLEGAENNYYCDICKITCTGPQCYTQHKMGARHRSLAGESISHENALTYDRTKWYPCEICKCSMNTYQQLKIHEMSSKHLKMLEKQKIGETQNQDRTQWFPCNICNVSMNTYEQLKIHEQSPRHIKQLQKQTLGEWFLCKICDVKVNTSEQLKIHEHSPRHLKQLEKQRKFNDIQQTSPSIAPSVQSTDSSLSLLEIFLSQELFPEEFLPPPESTANNGDAESLEANFQEQLVISPPSENNPYAATTRHYYCHTCRSTMNNKESYENHLRGSRHMQKATITETNEPKG